MNKTTRSKIETWILADLAIEPSNYYQMLKRLPDRIHPYDFCQCLESLVTADKIIKLKDTPNPDYQINRKHGKTTNTEDLDANV